MVEKVLMKHHEKFMESLPEKIRTTFNANAIITGGSIASLLLNEPVNDYDYYLRTREAVIMVAEHFISQFTGLNPKVSIKPTLRYGKDGPVKIMVKSAGVVSEAGDTGYQYFENLPDQFGQDYLEKVMSVADEVDAAPLDDKPLYRPVFMSANAITLSNKIQIVTRFYGEPDQIHENYDFIHCCNYWTPQGGLVLHPGALESLLCKHLQYQGSLYPVCSVIRTRKFLKQGWYINAGQYLKMCFQISALDLTNIEVLEDQLTGVDAAYFFQVIDYCKQRQTKDPDFKVTAPYLVSIIDKIFG